MGPIGFPELLIILVVALIVFGPRKLPELGRSLGKSLSEFKRASNELRSTLEEEIRIDEHKARTQAPPTSPGVPDPGAAAGSQNLPAAPETVARGEQGS
jgi:TatA/E family protein of Tat protein translocase